MTKSLYVLGGKGNEGRGKRKKGGVNGGQGYSALTLKAGDVRT